MEPGGKLSHPALDVSPTVGLNPTIAFLSAGSMTISKAVSERITKSRTE